MSLIQKNPFVGFMSDEELCQCSVGDSMVFDVECYPNFFLIAFGHLKSRKVYPLFSTDSKALNVDVLHWIARRFHLIGYYSENYDVPMLSAALHGWTCRQLYGMSKRMVEDGIRPWKLKETFGIEPVRWLNHVDLEPVVPLRGSLKMRGAQLHFESIQELPYSPHTELTNEQMRDVGFYNVNDLAVTAVLFKELESEYKLRCQMSAEYDVDLRSKSDAQIAEAVIGKQLEKLTGNRPSKPGKSFNARYKFKRQSWMSYSDRYGHILKKLEAEEFKIKDNGHIDCPDWLESAVIKLDCGGFRMGLGGLHSSEEKQVRLASDGRRLIDVDVTSFYPYIILNQGLYPKHLGESFLKVFKQIVERRVAAKQAGDKSTANSLKIVINGTFGKLADCYSIFYDPELMLQVTLSGQLALLKLIEAFRHGGIGVVSANTDGVVTNIFEGRYDTFEKVCKRWESETGFNLEFTEYEALYSRDVNNYIAHKKGGGVKLKGAYSNPWAGRGDDRFRKNPDCIVCIEAVERFLTDRVPIRQTIEACNDICKFVVVRRVEGGGTKDGHPVGKTVRWYYSLSTETPILTPTGGKVARSDGAMPALRLDQAMLSDVNGEAYVQIAETMLRDVGFYYTKSLFSSD